MSRRWTAASDGALGEALDRIKYDEQGLVPAIVQEASSGTVLMMAWMNAQTLALTLAEGRTVFWSRSRQEVWRKGETSGERQWLRRAYYDCDGDTLLFLVTQDGGGACHTGARSCFFRSFDGSDPTPREAAFAGDAVAPGGSHRAAQDRSSRESGLAGDG